MATAGRYSPGVKERAVRMVLEHEREHNSQWAAIVSIAGKIGCSPEALRKWVRRTENRHRPMWGPDQRPAGPDGRAGAGG